MKITTISCDNCGKLVERQLGDTYAITLKIQRGYHRACVVLNGNLHLCTDCWPKIIEASLEKH